MNDHYEKKGWVIPVPVKQANYQILCYPGILDTTFIRAVLRGNVLSIFVFLGIVRVPVAMIRSEMFQNQRPILCCTTLNTAKIFATEFKCER